jgi:hypothetical protein
MRRKTRACFRRTGKCEKGQALAETAIVIMTFLILVLGIIQLSMVMNAKMMTNYAAYCAARAGTLYNGNPSMMNDAAATALIPCFAWNTHTLFSGWVSANYAAMAGINLKVEILSPGPERFASNYRERFFPTLDRGFQTEPERRMNLLRVKVTYRFPLTIPLINTFMQPFFTDQPRIKMSSVCEMHMQSDYISMSSE